MDFNQFTNEYLNCLFIICKFNIVKLVTSTPIRDGNRAGQVQMMGSLPPSHMILYYPILALYDRENFLAPSLSLGALQSPAPPRKTLFLVNLPTTITIVFNKTSFMNKNIFEITNKFISSNQTNF